MKNKNEENEGRMKRIKKHFRDNRKNYALSAGSVLIGTIGTAAFMAGRGCDIKQIMVAYKPTNMTQTISKYGNRLGRPGIPVIDTTTGKRFESITLAARSIGVEPNKVWKHLRGDLSHVHEHVFEYA